MMSPSSLWFKSINLTAVLSYSILCAITVLTKTSNAFVHHSFLVHREAVVGVASSADEYFITSRIVINHSTIQRTNIAMKSSSSSFSPQNVYISKTTDLKNEIRRLAKETKNGLEASQSTRDEIQSCVDQLEQIVKEENSNLVSSESPNYTANEQLDGSWNLVYTTNGGSSAGKLGPFVVDVEQRVFFSNQVSSRNDSNYYINYVRLGGNIVEGALGEAF